MYAVHKRNQTYFDACLRKVFFTCQVLYQTTLRTFKKIKNSFIMP
ncbi:hypothetical protein YM392_2052 [Enterococcus faecalis]|nr:hypothetical protein ELS84_0774 [Enterococcus faecalis]OSH44845.1 hypothetical protein YM392_2052 [Enterococcus faecalis]